MCNDLEAETNILMFCCCIPFTPADYDFEPNNPNCVASGGKVSCASDADSVSALTKLRSVLPKDQYLLSTASWHVGMYGTGDFVASKPASIYTGEHAGVKGLGL